MSGSESGNKQYVTTLLTFMHPDSLFLSLVDKNSYEDQGLHRRLTIYCLLGREAAIPLKILKLDKQEVPTKGRHCLTHFMASRHGRR